MRENKPDRRKKRVKNWLYRAMIDALVAPSDDIVKSADFLKTRCRIISEMAGRTPEAVYSLINKVLSGYTEKGKRADPVSRILQKPSDLPKDRAPTAEDRWFCRMFWNRRAQCRVTWDRNEVLQMLSGLLNLPREKVERICTGARFPIPQPYNTRRRSLFDEEQK